PLAALPGRAPPLLLRRVCYARDFPGPSDVLPRATYSAAPNGYAMRVTDLLRTMDIFQALPSEELEPIAQLLRERRLLEGEVLCRQGEPGDALFIVTGGRIRLSTMDPSGNEKVLTYFTDGQFFGEMSLLTGAPRSASAMAETGSQVLVLQKHDFDELLASHTQIMREMLK